MNELRIDYIQLDPTVMNGFEDRCVILEDRTALVLDREGQLGTQYSLLRDFQEWQGKTNLCVLVDPRFAAGYLFFRSVNIVRSVLREDGVAVFSPPPPAFIFNISIRSVAPVLLYEGEISGEGGVDVATLANYTPQQLGGWFSSIDITEFDRATVSANFIANPDRFVFGELALQYHGFVASRFYLERRKTFIDMHMFFNSLEPFGETEEVSVWIPVPLFPRASAISWGLVPSVKGTIKVWSDVLLSGFSAYF